MLVPSAMKYTDIMKPMILEISGMDYFVFIMHIIIAFSFLSESILSLGRCAGGCSFDLDLINSIVPVTVARSEAAFNVSLRSFRALPS